MQGCFQNITAATINLVCKTNLWLTQVTENGSLNIENKPQFAKDQNNCNKPERNINKFEQVSIKEKESLPPSQKLFLLPQENNNKKKNIETNKVKEQMDLKQERKRKNLENKKVNLEKRLKTNNEEM